MKKFMLVAAAIALLSLGGIAQANITIDTVAVGDAGNASDIRIMTDGTTGYGAVDYNYNIGKYEVTAGQYTAFLNAVAGTDTYGLYNTFMSVTSYSSHSGISRSGISGSYTYLVTSDFVNRPVNFVSFWDSCRFANWLGNGQGSGSTETGAYTLNGYNGQGGRLIQRNAGATWAVTSEDEWYKAAYYKGGNTSSGYWPYPTQSDTAPGSNMADPFGNNANYDTGSGSYPIDSGNYTTVGGEFQNSASAYGTFDQGGNVWEWNEAISYINISEDYAYRGFRGGAFYRGTYDNLLQSSFRENIYPSYEVNWIGFRVSDVSGTEVPGAGAAVPEPMSIMLAAGGLITLFGIRRRKA